MHTYKLYTQHNVNDGGSKNGLDGEKWLRMGADDNKNNAMKYINFVPLCDEVVLMNVWLKKLKRKSIYECNIT